MSIRKIIFSSLVGIFLTGTVVAQGVAQNVLDELQISKSNYTGIIKIKFRIPARYVSHSPQQKGKEIHIRVNFLSRVARSNLKEIISRESLVPQVKDNFSLEEVSYERVLRDDYVTLYFSKEVSFEIIQDSNYRSISVLVHDVK